MENQGNKSRLQEETDSDRLGGLIADDALSLDLVSGFAGDRQLTMVEKDFFDNMKNKRGHRFYGDLLYAISHQHFPPEVAHDLWKNILQHKHKMSEAMKRDIRIVVATLDYLCNLTKDLHSTTLIGEKHMADIVRMSLRDGLAGLYNHAYCHQAIDTELKRYSRYGTITSLMMIDIDDFKDVNDRYGHQDGDKVLAMVGAIIETETRDIDICCRYGGEEFVVLLPLTDIGETALLAERLRAKIEQSIPCGRKITISIGVSSCGENNNAPKSLIKRADDALYEAKTAGKNRVVVNKIG
jgi:diguanylate cyclase (GGDEF)-like protein